MPRKAAHVRQPGGRLEVQEPRHHLDRGRHPECP
jgi:hypothetical protein